MDYGKITLNINRILEEKRVSKNSICKALDIPRSNFNIAAMTSNGSTQL